MSGPGKHPKCCLNCGRWGTRGYLEADGGREGWVCANDAACARRGASWMYGFYDTDPDGVHRYDFGRTPEPQTDPTIFWYVFGFLTHETIDSALHTAGKSVWGQAVIVRRRRDGKGEWEHAPGYDHTGRMRESVAGHKDAGA